MSKTVYSAGSRPTVEEIEGVLRRLDPEATIEYCWVSVDGEKHYQKTNEGIQYDIVDEVREWDGDKKLFCIYC